RDGRPPEGRRNTQPQSFAEDLAQKVSLARADGETDAELSRALTDREIRRAEEADGSKEEGQRDARQKESRARPIWPERQFEAIAHAVDRCWRHMRHHRANRVAERDDGRA